MIGFTIPIAFWWIALFHPIDPGHLEVEKNRCVEVSQGTPVTYPDMGIIVMGFGLVRVDVLVCYDPEKYSLTTEGE